MADIIKTSETTFHQDVIEASLPVIVDFTAAWCQPCKQLEPLLIELADEWQGQLSIIKLDVDENPQVAVDYQVMGLPTLLLFKGGKVVERLTGYQSKDRLQKKFAPHMS